MICKHNWSFEGIRDVKQTESTWIECAIVCCSKCGAVKYQPVSQHAIGMWSENARKASLRRDKIK